MAMKYYCRLDEALRVFATRQAIMSALECSSLAPHLITYQGVKYLDEYPSLILEKRSGQYKLFLTLMESSTSRWVGKTKRILIDMMDEESGEVVTRGVASNAVKTIGSDLTSLGITCDFISQVRRHDGVRCIVVGIEGNTKCYEMRAELASQIKKMIRSIVEQIKQDAAK